MLANSLIELDRAHLVHPVASWRGHEAAGVRLLASAKGATVTDAEGRTLVDGFAGLWCVNAGYGHESVIAAAERQLRVLPYATGYFGLGSEPAIRLAARLAELAPGDLDHVYFTLGGSDAVDSSVRFVRYYWHARGKPQKDQFISLEQGYHGSTTVGAGLTALPVFHAGFGVPYDWQHKIPSHHVYRNPVGSDPEAIIAASTAALRAKVAALGGPERVAAFYAEPIQGSGGVLVPPAGLDARDARALRRARHPLRRRRGDHRLRPHRAALRLRGGRHRPRPDDRGQGAHLGLRTHGRGAALPTTSTRRSPTGRAPPRSATASPTRGIRCRPRSRSRCSTSTRAGSSRTVGRWGRGCRPGSRASPTTRSSATCAAAACSRRWSS